VVFPVTTRANAALVNEEVFGFEGGVDFAPDERLKLSLTLFDNRVRQAIANVTIGPNLRQRQNLDAVRARGIEFDGAARLGPLTLSGSLAFTDARVEASGAALPLNSKRPAQTPRLLASAGASWQPRNGWLLAAGIRHQGAQFEDDLETDRLPAATTLHAYAELPITKAATLVLRAENLTDADVITRNQAGSIDLGAPRTLWVGVKLGLGN
jgi:outer membrane receptor protein involved in Fe transport